MHKMLFFAASSKVLEMVACINTSACHRSLLCNEASSTWCCRNLKCAKMKKLAQTHKHKTSHAEDYRTILTGNLNMNPFYLKKKKKSNLLSVYFIVAICYFMNIYLSQLQ